MPNPTPAPKRYFFVTTTGDGLIDALSEESARQALRPQIIVHVREATPADLTYVQKTRHTTRPAS